LSDCGALKRSSVWPKHRERRVRHGTGRSTPDGAGIRLILIFCASPNQPENPRPACLSAGLVAATRWNCFVRVRVRDFFLRHEEQVRG